MAIEQKIMEDAVKQALIVTTEIGHYDLNSSYNQADFFAAIYREMAVLIAGKVFKKVAPAIDKAMAEMVQETTK